MTITAQNLAYSQQGPIVSGEQMGPSQLEAYELSFLGTVTFTGDAGGSTSAVLNYIDGTNALNFVPRGFFFSRIGGTSTATITATQIVDNADGGKTGTVTFSSALGSGSTLKLMVAIVV